MRKNQAAQSIALAFGLVGGLGFLGYTMLGDMLVSDPSRTEQVVPASAPKKSPTTNAGPRTTPPVGPAVVPVAVAAQTNKANDSPTSQLAGLEAAATGTAQPSPIHKQVDHRTPVQSPAFIAPVSQPVAEPSAQAANAATVKAMPSIPSPVATALQSSADSGEVAAPQRRAQRRRQAKPVHRPTQNTTTPVIATAQTRITEQPSGAKVVTVQHAAPAPTSISQAPAVSAEPKATAPVQAATTFSSREDMAVTISGQKAWVQVSPTRTMEAKKGDVLPNLGKILEIRGNQVVAEKGTLTTN